MVCGGAIVTRGGGGAGGWGRAQDVTSTTAATLGMSGLAYGPGGGADVSAQALSYTITAIPSLVTIWKSDGTTPVTAGMEVTTDSEPVHRARKMNIELLLSAGRHNCLVCEANGACELQDLVFTALTDTRFYGLYYDIPSLCFGASGAAMHGFNEYVDLESLKKATKAMALFIAEWCGVEKV